MPRDYHKQSSITVRFSPVARKILASFLELSGTQKGLFVEKAVITTIINAYEKSGNPPPTELIEEWQESYEDRLFNGTKKRGRPKRAIPG